MVQDRPWMAADAARYVPAAAWTESLLPAALDELDFPLMIVDRGLTQRWANRVAQWQRARGTVFASDGQRLLPRDAGERDRLMQAVSAAIDRGVRRWLSLSGQTFAVLPLGEGGALVIGGRSGVCQTLSIDGFARQCGLTSSEAQVLHALCAGQSPAQIARERGVKLTTVRTQLGTLRMKVGARDIRALVQRVATLPPMVGLLAGVSVPTQ